jgi:integrase
MKRYKKPKIYHGGANYDLKKRWYVYYDFINPDTNNFVRQTPLTFKINQRYKTKEERMLHLKALRDSLENLLKRGYSPYEEKENNNNNFENAFNFALSIKKKEVKQTTYKDYESRISLFKTFLFKQGYRYSFIKEIDKKCVNTFLNTIEGAKNRNNTKASLSSIFSVLADNDLIETNFIKEIRNKKTEQKAVRIYKENELSSITEQLREQDFTLLMFVYFVSYTFTRPIEAVRIKVEDIDLENKLIKLNTKTKELKTKIIPDIIFNDLKAFINDKKGFIFNDSSGSEIQKRNYYTKRFLKFRTKNKIDADLKLYSFRHTFITKVYLELRKDYTKEDAIKRLSLITGHSIQIYKGYVFFDHLLCS